MFWLDVSCEAGKNAGGGIQWLKSNSIRQPSAPTVCARSRCSRVRAFDFIEIDVTDDAELRQKMVELSGGRRTVPEIFINGKIVGGYDDLKALNDKGELDAMLAA